MCFCCLNYLILGGKCATDHKCAQQAGAPSQASPIPDCWSEFHRHIGFPIRDIKDHLAERLLDPAQLRAPYAPLFWGHSRTGRGGGFSQHFNFAWEISRFRLTVKFPMRNSGFSANFSHTSGAHCGLWRVVIHSTRGFREISHSEIYHREFDLVRNYAPSCSIPRCTISNV